MLETDDEELQANSRPATTIRSYGMDLLRWWRFLSGWGVAWDRVSRRDARDFARWMQIASKGSRVHWRHPASGEGPSEALKRPAAGVPNPGATFTIGDAVFVRTKNATTAGTRDDQGTLRHFSQAEHRAF
ncbi:site-specific integrase [Streptomyces cellulosae]|uniref:Site-specific integrase n=1 Tax=Streptomyces cellulosae TaxID=1968 RepID=A0ABW7YGP7_STRCE